MEKELEALIEADIAPLQAGAASGELSSLSGEPPSLSGEPPSLSGDAVPSGEPPSLSGEPPSLTGEPPSLSGDAVPGGEAAFRTHVQMKPALDESDLDGEVMGPPKKVLKRTLARHDSACSSFSLLDDISDEEPVGEDVQLGDADIASGEAALGTSKQFTSSR